MTVGDFDDDGDIDFINGRFRGVLDYS